MGDCCSKIEFTESRIVYCSTCGTAYNKERIGKSEWEYSTHTTNAAMDKYTGGTIYFKLVNYNGVGNEFLNYIEFRPVYGSGLINADGANICFKTRHINISRRMSGRGSGNKKGLDNVEFSHSMQNPRTEEFGITSDVKMTDVQIFDTSDIEYNALVIHKIRPTLYVQVSKEEFDTFEAKIQHITNELSSICAYVGK